MKTYPYLSLKNAAKIKTNLRCDDHFIGASMYEPQKHGVNDDLYWGHGSHHTQVVHHQKSVRRQVSVSEIMEENHEKLCLK